MRRRLSILFVVGVCALVVPAAALAHEAPENQRSRWVMVDWMLETFFIFGGLALAAFIWAWKAGHFHNLEEQARIPLLIHEEDYYTPEWALDEEEWT
jgi:protein-S-isoprenylcysteine O-methyltransferase Ste14